jgi:actin-related protein
MKKELLQSFPTVPGGVASILKITPDPANREPGSHWQRKHAAWIGGSMFASLDTFKQVQSECHMTSPDDAGPRLLCMCIVRLW